MIQHYEDRELQQAVELLRSVRSTYETNQTRIVSQARAQEKNLAWGQTINWDKVYEMVENSINWWKVVKLAKQTIPPQSVEKIQNTTNQELFEEYEGLVKFLMKRLNYLQRKEIEYLTCWKNTPQYKRRKKTYIFIMFSLFGVLAIGIGWLISLRIQERNFFEIKSLQHTIEAYETYLERHPQGRFVSEARFRIEQLFWEDAKSRHDYQSYIDEFPNGKFVSEAKSKIRDRYISISLPTGYMPWANYFGRNNHCTGSGCSQIRITAGGSDVVVIVRSGNRVVRHAYIRATETFTFNVPNGTFQTFFYSGRGWSQGREFPQPDGTIILGRFIENESVGRGNPETLNNHILTYTLREQISGNFRQIPSCLSEALAW